MGVMDSHGVFKLCSLGDRKFLENSRRDAIYRVSTQVQIDPLTDRLT